MSDLTRTLRSHHHSTPSAQLREELATLSISPRHQPPEQHQGDERQGEDNDEEP